MKFHMPNKPDISPEAQNRIEDGRFDAADIWAIIWTTVKKLTDKAAIILWSSFLMLLLWGFHGNMEVIRQFFGSSWIRKVTFGLGWGEQLVSYVAGFFLVVVIPCIIIKVWFKSNLREYGLGWPNRKNRHKAWVAFSTLLIFTSIFVISSSVDKGMQKEYPLFQKWNADGTLAYTISHGWEFLIYELIYLFFFITIEFAFRGYLLFGLYSIQIKSVRSTERHWPLFRFGLYSILIQMLAYTTWHYGKPVPEIVGTVFWGVGVAAIALRIRSLWPIIIAHWLYNVFLDFIIWRGWHKQIEECVRSVF
ncbi:CPBP family intramembrane metalloprotease [bacterium]|nr:CPBP family intramembrane metalloprotease [bacterium]